jgi:hypothetical protein
MVDPANTSARSLPLALQRVYLPATGFALIIAIVGFWPTYYGKLLAGQTGASLLIHVHAAVMVGWLILFGVQAWFAATGHIGLHKRLGRMMGWYILVLIALGTAAALAAFAHRLAGGNRLPLANAVFVLVLHDMVVFGVLFWAAWYYRKRPELHRRLMLVATTALLLPAVSRMAFLGRPVPVLEFSLVWLLPIYLAMAYDFVKLRIVHPVYLLSVGLLVAVRFRRPMADTEIAQAFATWVAGFLVGSAPG